MARIKWNQIVEIVSSVAVIVTLIILIIEIRENTATIKSQSYGATVDRMNAWRLELAKSPELSRLYNSISQGTWQDLNPEELTQLSFYYSSLWAIYESAYYAQEYETLGLSEWLRFQSQICRQFTISEKSLWEGTATRLSPDFIQYVETNCRE